MKLAQAIPTGNDRHDLQHSARIAWACLDLTSRFQQIYSCLIRRDMRDNAMLALEQIG
jgi:hypothetical protein